MPQIKSQENKSPLTISLQPDKTSSRIEAIMYMDIAGKTGNQIADILGLTASRVSIIRTSPMYRDMITKEKETLRVKFMDNQVNRLSGDPVEEALKDAALAAAKTKIDLMTHGRSEFVRLHASGDILDRAGYRAHETKTTVSVEISDKIADRFEAALSFSVRFGGETTGHTGRGSAFGGDPANGGEFFSKDRDPDAVGDTDGLGEGF